MPERRYIRATAFDRAFNAVPAFLARLGISLYGSRLLAVRGRRSGEWRTVPVNLLELDGVQYLVAPRGETDWVRNLRAAGRGTIRLEGRDVAVRARALAPREAEAFFRAELRAYVGELPWLWRGAASIFGREQLRNPAKASQLHPVFELVAEKA